MWYFTYLSVLQAPCVWVHRQHLLKACVPVAVPRQLVVQAPILCQLHDQAHVGRCQAGTEGVDDVGVMGVAQDLHAVHRRPGQDNRLNRNTFLSLLPDLRNWFMPLFHTMRCLVPKLASRVQQAST
jgi:hypothetical protein